MSTTRVKESVTVWVVYRGWDRDSPLVLHSHPATRTEKQVKFIGQTGLAFHCRTQGHPVEFDYTPEDAIARFRHSAQMGLENAQARLDEAQRDLAELDGLVVP